MLDQLIPQDYLLRKIDKYIYDYNKDIYTYPNNVALIYKTTARKGYKEYRCFVKIIISLLFLIIF